jgi:PAS domain S-box-containing protein
MTEPDRFLIPPLSPRDPASGLFRWPRSASRHEVPFAPAVEDGALNGSGPERSEGADPASGGRLPRLAEQHSGPPAGPKRASPTEPEVEVALLDPAGVIVAVNGAWEAFCEANGGDSARIGVGSSYLEACAAVAGDPVADQVAEAIRSALQGDLPVPMKVEVLCHSPDTSRWFETLISSRLDDDGRCLGATVTLSMAGPVALSSRDRHGFPSGELRPPGAAGAGGGQRRSGPSEAAFYPDHSERLGDGFAQVCLELVPDGILVSDDDGLILRANRQAEELFGYDHDELVGMPVECLLPKAVPQGDGELATGSADRRPSPSSYVGLDVLGIHADGSGLPVQISLGPVAMNRGTGAVVLIREVHRPRDQNLAKQSEALTDGMARMTDDLAEVIRKLFACGLTVASILGSSQVEDHNARRLHSVLSDLDGAVRDIRETIFTYLLGDQNLNDQVD